ncbi:MAG TPA: hypothetical protein VND65_11345 [Candidatus Binatia bacterium]|nr:hypothetical protein [Candidatus Binatia bacterium]
MGMTWRDWPTDSLKITEMEQVLEGLRRLRDGHIAFPDSVVRAIDEAITETETRLALLKNATVD